MTGPQHVGSPGREPGARTGTDGTSRAGPSLLVVLGLLVVLVACGQGADPATQATAAPSDAPSSEPVPGDAPPATRSAEPACPQAERPLAEAGDALVERAKATDRNTVFLATVDGDWAEGTNAVWCTTLEMAWRELGKAFGGPPIRVDGDEPVAVRLGKAAPVPIPDGASWVRAGPCKADVIELARTDLCKAFPRSANLWTPISPGDGYFSVAYLEAGFEFKYPYRLIEKEHHFFSADDDGTCVTAFGIPEDAKGRLAALRGQLAVLYDAHRFKHDRLTGPDKGGHGELDAEFILDLDRNSSPYQLLLARVDRRGTLGDTWARVLRLLRHAAEQDKEDERTSRPGLGMADSLRIPCMHWDLEHEFTELMGLKVMNEGFHAQTIDRVYQRTKFRLDNKGVDMSSIATVATRGAGGRAYVFESPYLVVLRKRGAEAPFFLLFVEDATLLKKRS